MKRYQISHKGGKIAASIHLERSKSISNRALLIRALTKNKFPIHYLSTADDTITLNQLLEKKEANYDVGAAGTTMRFLVAFLAIKEGNQCVITGSDRMKNRPIKVLVDVLRNLGAEIEYVEKEGYPPLKIIGKQLEGGEIDIDAGISSQYISALLMIAPMLKKGLQIHLKGAVVSRPYIQMTLSLMRYFGVDSDWKGNCIQIKPQDYQSKDYTVESDWSAASYWYFICALSDEGSEIFLQGLLKESVQGDSQIEEIMKSFGVHTVFKDDGVLLTKRTLEVGVNTNAFDLVNCPDLAQTVVTCFGAFNKTAHFKGLVTLKIKETDRVEALQKELNKYGVLFNELKKDELWEVTGKMDMKEVQIQTYEDHRMAMAFAPLAIRNKRIIIEEPKVVTKSYPNYWKHLTQAGFQIEEL